MLKISRIGPCEYNKSCSIFHHEFNKIEFVIFWIFYDFLRILQDSAKQQYYWSYNFAVSPLDFLQVHNRAPILRISPQKFSSPRNVTPGGGSRRGSLESGELAHARDRRWVGKGSPTPKGSIPGVGWP
jgi:hypothetical protein